MKLKTYLLLLIVVGFSSQIFSQNEVDLLILNKNYEQAIQAINKQIEVKPEASLYFKKGIIYGELQNYQEALNAYSEALILDPNNIEILSEMAENLSTLGNQMDAEKFFKKAIQLNPDNLTLRQNWDEFTLIRRKYRSAYDIFSEIYAIDSSNVFWNKQLAYCSFQTQRRLEAIHLYEKVIGRKSTGSYNLYQFNSRLQHQKRSR